jgi:hypothetical protein
MAFVKLSRKVRKKVLYPDLYITRTNATLNMAFCEAIGLTEVGGQAGLDLLHDEETGNFALKIYTKNPERGEILATYNASHQCQVYIKTMLRQADISIKEPCHCELKLDTESKLWVFSIPKESTESTKESETVKQEIRKTKNKIKRRDKTRKTKILKKD